jgi:hypothetical protein
MNRLLYWIGSRLPLRIIDDEGRPYLERYYLFTLLGVRCYLHRFVGSDPARGLHDHPWPWAGSILLSGSYLEQTRAGLARVRWFNWLLGDSFHRVVLDQDAMDQPIFVWTLFFHRAKYVKHWGFLREWPNERTMLWSKYGAQPLGEDKPWWLSAPQGRFEARRVGR